MEIFINAILTFQMKHAHTLFIKGEVKNDLFIFEG